MYRSSLVARRSSAERAGCERPPTGDGPSYFRLRLPSYFSTFTNTPIST